MFNLPKCDSSHELNRKVTRKFLALVEDTNKFVVRVEQGIFDISDYGVDVVLELKANGHMTNLRTHGQLKGTKQARRLKQNNSVSFPVPLKTLSYLLNQPDSFFAVYLEDDDQFMWAWAEDIKEYALRNEVKIREKEQSSINYHFTSILDDQSLELIYSRVSRQGKLVRSVSIIEQFPLEEFEEEERLEYEPILLSKTKVQARCFLPGASDLSGSMMLSFSRFPFMNLELVDHDIVNSLLEGLESPPVLRLRPFIRAVDKDSKQFFVCLGNCSITLNENEVNELCSVIDRLGPLYINAVKTVESILASSRFNPRSVCE